MATPEVNPHPISEELFDRFRSSSWPNMFGHIAHAAHEKGKPIDHDVLKVPEIGLIIAPREKVKILREVGIVEETFARRTSDIPTPHFTEFGKQVIAACEGLFTPEEYAAQNEAARPELELQLAEAKAELGTIDQQ
jgi:hypothetical protein